MRIQDNSLMRKLLLIFCLLAFCGCGYRFAPEGEYMDQRIKTVFIDNFTNKTAEAQVEDELRNAFISKFSKGGRLRLADTKAQAHAVLTGSVENLSSTHLSVNINALAMEERISLTADFTLIRQDNGFTIWSRKNMEGRADYLVDRDLNVTQINRKNALTLLTQDLAERAYLLMMSGF